MIDFIKTLSQLCENRLSQLFPHYYWHKYADKARQLGLADLYIILSYDCDTDEDANAALELNNWLVEHNIKATYAVPGFTLQNNSATYREIAKTGAEFINHGYQPHAAWSDAKGHYISSCFYHEMSTENISHDIQQGHDTVQQINGIPPSGFRAPHFGLFNAPDQLALLHQILRKLQYKYSSSTVPKFAFQYGPLWNVGGIIEIPVSGPFKAPLTVHDSHRYIIGPTVQTIKDQYAIIFQQTIDRFLQIRIPVILNYYADPVHVYKNKLYYEVLSHCKEQGVKFVNFSELLDTIYH